MYDYGYDYATNSAQAGLIGGLAMFVIVAWLIGIAIGIFNIICLWKVYKKAGKQGWECIVPIYNTIVLLEIAGLPLWYIILYFIPVANIYAVFKTYIELAHRFNKSTAFGIGLVFLPIVFFAILAFEKDSQVSTDNQDVAMNGQTADLDKFCPNCGTKIDNDTAFCPNCGSQIN